jgi:hypothetical protein
MPHYLYQNSTEKSTSDQNGIMTRKLRICNSSSAAVPQTSTACEFEKTVKEFQVCHVVISLQVSAVFLQTSNLLFHLHHGGDHGLLAGPVGLHGH